METPLIRVKQLGYVRVEAVDKASAEQFLQEFGLQVVERTNGQTYFRGTDAATPCYILSEGPGTVTTIAFEAESLEDLQTLSKLPEASEIYSPNERYGGKIVQLTDPVGMSVEVYDDDARPVYDEKGEMVCNRPFPSMPIYFWDDEDGARYRSAYFERFPNVWCQGDFVSRSEREGWVIYGRSDATLNPGGVRIGTAEIYRQVEQFDEVVEGIVIGQEWDNDTRVVLFVILRDGLTLGDDLVDRIRKRVRQNCTPRHVPAKVVQVTDIPRTKSGKITELAVRDVVHGRPVKNVEALANPQALEFFNDREELKS